MRDIAQLIISHYRRYPALELGDIYRLIHQSVFGAGSPIPNKKTAREWLDHEAKLANSRPMPPLLESVHPDDEVVRLYLGPYQAAGGTLNALLETYMKSAEASSKLLSDPNGQMADNWALLLGLIGPDGALAGKFDLRTAQLMESVHRRENWPAVAHSAAYLHYYQPFYRVFLKSYADQLLMDHRIPAQVE